MQTIVAFCHLRWDFVYQRPQHLLTRLARHYRVYFVEEPVRHDGPVQLHKSTPAPNVTVCQPYTPLGAPGFHDDQITLLQPLLAQLLAAGDNPIAWLYTPMALPLLPDLHPRLVVYDCMDELSAFKDAPKQLLQRENSLLKRADLVFTGGPSLYEAKRARHANVHCLPSSVDAAHFRQARERSRVHALQAAIATPRLGYYGVIDERFDGHLMGAVADAHPDWQLVVVGPVLKIDPATLPQRQNIHYLGMQAYEALPHLLAGWDVCLMPFALNEATRFISPTKVLEYMAAEVPIVSTPITDVARPYGDVVRIGHDTAAFIAACEAALAQDGAQHDAMATRMRAIVAATSWDASAERMRVLLECAASALAAGATDAEPLPAAPARTDVTSKVNPLRPTGAALMTGRLILGAGPTGLSAAYHSEADTVLLERRGEVGGLCRSVQDHGFTFDHAGHIMFSNDPYVHALYEILLGENVQWQLREAWVYSKNVFTRYPFQGALHGLPPDVIKECLLGAIEARYAGATCPTAAPAAAAADCCADGTAVASANPGAGAAAMNDADDNFEAFIQRVWGSGIAKHFAIPYNRKLWTVPLHEMETSWLGGRVPLPDLGEIIDGALQAVAKPMGPNARFGYPRKGGFQALMNGFLPHIRGRIELHADAVELLPAEHLLVLADGRRYRYDQLISTIPLPQLVKLAGALAPPAVHAAAGALRHVSVRCVNLGIDGPARSDKHWIYYPEDTLFHRIFLQGNVSAACNAPGGFGFTCEISYSPWKPLPVDGDALIARCIADCIAVGMLRPDDRVIAAHQLDLPYAYVVYDHARARNVAAVRDWMAQHDIVLAGRYSEWEYYNSDHAFLAGKRAAENGNARLMRRTSLGEG